MRSIFARIGEALAPFLDRFQPIILLDCAKSHLSWRVVATASRNNLWVAYIPASLTWLLQPCDTHVFAAYKAAIDARYSALRSESAAGEVSDEQWLRVVCETIIAVLRDRDWAHAFAQNGFPTLDAVRREIKAELGPEALPAVTVARPTLDDLRAVYPRRSRVPEAHLWRPVDQLPTPKAVGLEAAGPSAVHADAVARLRPRRRLPADARLPMPGPAAPPTAPPEPPVPRAHKRRFPSAHHVGLAMAHLRAEATCRTS